MKINKKEIRKLKEQYAKEIVDNMDEKDLYIFAIEKISETISDSEILLRQKKEK